MKNLTMALAMMGVLAAGANATTWRWTWDRGPAGYSAAAGPVQFAEATYNTTTQRFTYEVRIGRASNGKLANGIYAAFNDGPNPKGIAGELPIFYFDASSSQPVLTAYGYNGLNTTTSWQDGSPAAGTQAPDRIRTSRVNGSWVNQLSVVTANNTRTFRFDIDGSVINSFRSQYGRPQDWNGVKFGPKFGIWAGFLQDLHTQYNHDGYLKSFNHGTRGYIDLSHQQAVPEPATMTALGLGLAAIVRKHRAKKA